MPPHNELRKKKERKTFRWFREVKRERRAFATERTQWQYEDMSRQGGNRRYREKEEMTINGINVRNTGKDYGKK